MLQVKKVSGTTSPSSERLVIVEASDGNDEARVFYGTSLGNEDLQMSTFPKPRAMANSNKQVQQCSRFCFCVVQHVAPRTLPATQ